MIYSKCKKIKNYGNCFLFSKTIKLGVIRNVNGLIPIFLVQILFMVYVYTFSWNKRGILLCVNFVRMLNRPYFGIHILQIQL